MKPAIEVYGEYLNNPTEFFQQLPQHQATWILFWIVRWPVLNERMNFIRSAIS